MKGAFVVNPAAGNGRAGKQWPQLAAQLKAHGIEGKVVYTAVPGEATAITRRLLEAGHDTLLAVGGDGTINEVANGFFAGEEPLNKAARLGILSCGTGADLVKSLGLGPGAKAIRCLAEGHTAALDVGLAVFHDWAGRPVKRHFLNFSDLGMGGETVARVNHTTKALGGFVSFLMGALRAILAYKGKTAEIVLDDGQPVQQVVCDIVVANGQYFGGGMHVAPAASLMDGLFDVFVLGDVPKARLIFDLLPRVYRGTHVGHRDIWGKRARRLVVRSKEQLLVDIDGELVGTSDAEFSMLPAALPVIVPQKFSTAR